MVRHASRLIILAGFLAVLALPAFAQEGGRIVFTDPKSEGDEILSEEDLEVRRHSWGADLMIGTDGFGLGFFYNYAFSDVISGFANLSFSEAKDDRQRDVVDSKTIR